MKLFDVIVDKKELHPDFVRCQKDKYKVEVLEEWADDDLIYRDGNNKFVKEFQTTFNSALWELYCCCYPFFLTYIYPGCLSQN